MVIDFVSKVVRGVALAVILIAASWAIQYWVFVSPGDPGDVWLFVQARVVADLSVAVLLLPALVLVFLSGCGCRSFYLYLGSALSLWLVSFYVFIGKGLVSIVIDEVESSGLLGALDSGRGWQAVVEIVWYFVFCVAFILFFYMFGVLNIGRSAHDGPGGG
ncbi:hypothetical protein FKV24_009350 [Lysobacter maris]|uniref:Uncharacterized protein n=1 Tax=Marilutibacter maris TaxID=1605891 RepID=A0A508ARG0_9GAMM|nr:hypothetical protein [Lysobacter maris]KAB8189475.1 hypothetical protein FKV24_009350 [Lysobacter maris]